MKTITAQQADEEAARQWCAGILSGAGSRIKGGAAEKWFKIGIDILLNTHKKEMSEDEKRGRCSIVSWHHDEMKRVVCEVDGEEFVTCDGCPFESE